MIDTGNDSCRTDRSIMGLLGAAPKVAKTDPKAYALTLQARQLYRQGYG